ncbi:DUF2971 domain-containing protein [Algoriphagus sp. C2-6-M1]|uniref:DUF2971 domain-containing protein n=1 Tax=Algoriphagus persicinus TaxID=3108754 RepID=UPI002B36BF52|nr:DUF2971 domain-containing protein [Algoriphagus sp. C2-6-M1]MEB2780012.1 DUF2971 domain-containing protein [Algoriphagus sp. C2-6-M1]
MIFKNIKHLRTFWQILKPKPKALYKYHSINRNLIKLLRNNSLWAGSASNLNDPYDCDFEMSREFLKETIFDKLSIAENGRDPKSPNNEDWFWDGLASVLNEEQIKTFQRFSRQSIGICSFSSKPDSELMWSHYADSGKGICLEFDFSTNDYFKEKLIPIRYSNKVILAKNDLDRSKAYIKKRKAWGYEKEWRIIENVGTIPFNKTELVRVIFGPQVHKKCFEIVIKTLAKNGYTPIIAMCQYTKSGLEIEEVLDTKKFIESDSLREK